MKRLFYKPDDGWFGDAQPFEKDGKLYLFYLKDTKNPKPMVEPFGWDLVITDDFLHFENKGTVIPHGRDDEQDQFIFSGSVIQDGDGLFQAFYAAHNWDFPKSGKPQEVIMQSQSKDLLTWEKTNLAIHAPAGYDRDDWRDPFVFWDEQGRRYLMLLAARKIQGKRLLNGCNVYYESSDLRNWVFKGPFYEPNTYVWHEVPDLFQMGEWWYLIFSEVGSKSKMVYRMSKSMMGPWIIPDDDAFDGKAYYAARTSTHKGRRYLFGWVHQRPNNEDQDGWLWAGHLLVQEVIQRSNGTLGIKAPDTVLNAFKNKVQLDPIRLSSDYACAESTIEKHTGDLFCFQADCNFSSGTYSFMIKLYEDNESGEGYQFKFYIPDNRLCFERVPNHGYNQIMMSLERPIVLAADQDYKIRLIVDDTIVVLYVNDVALTARMYRHPGESLTAAVINGSLRMTNISIAKG
jgi:beta-fructofuranosidase